MVSWMGPLARRTSEPTRAFWPCLALALAACDAEDGTDPTDTSMSTGTDLGTDASTSTSTATGSDTDTNTDTYCPEEPPLKDTPCAPSETTCEYYMGCGDYPNKALAHALCWDGAWHIRRGAVMTGTYTETALHTGQLCPCGPPGEHDICDSLPRYQEEPCTYGPCDAWQCADYPGPWEPATSTDPRCQ